MIERFSKSKLPYFSQGGRFVDGGSLFQTSDKPFVTEDSDVLAMKLLFNFSILKKN